LLLVNTPHNPTGTVLDDAELSAIAQVACAHDLLVVTDEVYEHLTFDGIAHRPLATFPGMRERTVTISSAGKTFSFTGWKVGWASGPAHLVAAVNTAKQFMTFTSGAPLQPAIAAALALPDDYYAEFRTTLQGKRDRLCAGLAEVGFEVFVPQGTYFITTDVRPLGFDDGLAFCRELPGRCGVVAVPHQVFYDDIEAGRPMVRWAFCKRDEVLDEAVERLAKGLR
jgi:N-succinyldiaminopimelate aminotransferase